mgnify:FL=1
MKHLQKINEAELSEDSQQCDSTTIYHNEGLADHSFQLNSKEIKLLPPIMPKYYRLSSDPTTDAEKSAKKSTNLLSVPKALEEKLSGRKVKNRLSFNDAANPLLKHANSYGSETDDLRKLIQNSLKTKAHSHAASESFSQYSSSPDRDSFSAQSMSPEGKRSSR